MKAPLFMLCMVGLFAGGCSRFAGEWVEEGRMDRQGQFVRTEGPRRMALRFEAIATVRSGAYVDGPKVVDHFAAAGLNSSLKARSAAG